MQRRIVELADVSGNALADLKSWLGITRPNEDALLTDLLHMALAMCEGFTGQAPLSQLVEERLPLSIGQSSLTSRPVSSISAVELVLQDADRTELTSSQYEARIEAGGNVTFRQFASLDGQAVVVTSRVGIGETWADVPAPLKQGIIRLCAYHYHDRDRPNDTRKASSPPTSVTALWRPWQDLRLT
jgi:uncharacterized phiE125 gp8 family phage protein